jgi:hypothetical protein
VCYIIRHIARQRNLPQVAGIHRDGEIMLDRPAQLSRADSIFQITCGYLYRIYNCIHPDMNLF